MGTFSLAYVTAGDIVTASVHNRLIDECTKFNVISAAQFVGATAVVPNANLIAGKSIFSLRMSNSSVNGNTVAAAGSLSCRTGVLYADATLVGALYSRVSVAAAATAARCMLYVNNSTAIASTVSVLSSGAVSQGPSAITKTSFAVGDTIDLKAASNNGAIRDIAVDLYFKIQHKS